MHSLLETPNGKGMAVAAETPKPGPSTFDLEHVKIRVFYEPSRLFPRGTERTFDIAQVEPYVEPTQKS